MKTKWINWSQRLSAIAQNGLNYSESSFDKERYSSVREIAAEIMAEYSDSNKPYHLSASNLSLIDAEESNALGGIMYFTDPKPVDLCVFFVKKTIGHLCGKN